MTQDADTTLTALDPAACSRLLAATTFGRLAVVDEGKPVIVVLNHLAVELHGAVGQVLFRTGEGARLERLTGNGRAVNAVFEVDSSFAADRSGWSVIATGLLTRERDHGRCAQAAERIATWADGERDVVLRLDVHGLEGRRVGPLTR